MGPRDAREMDFWEQCYAAVLASGKGNRIAQTQAQAALEHHRAQAEVYELNTGAKSPKAA